MIETFESRSQAVRALYAAFTAHGWQCVNNVTVDDAPDQLD